jgi:UDP-N-acetylmuramyl pentapeptide synthase
MQELKSVIPQRIHSATVKNWEQAITELKKVVEDGDNVLVKGSNSLGLEKLVEALKVGNI